LVATYLRVFTICDYKMA